jgi:uncharacterized protein
MRSSNEDDDDHARYRAALGAGHRLIVPTTVIAEASYLIGTRLGPDIEAQFLRGLASTHIEPPTPDDWARIADLVRSPSASKDVSRLAVAGSRAIHDRRSMTGSGRPEV